MKNKTTNALLICVLAILAFKANATTIIATNDHSGVFTDGLFKLPTLDREFL